MDSEPFKTGRMKFLTPGTYWLSAAIFLLSSTLLLGAVQTLHYLDKKDLQQQNVIHSRDKILKARSEFRSYVRHAVGDMKVLLAAPTLLSLAAGNDPETLPEYRRQLNLRFETFATNKPWIMQLRFLDNRGYEIARTDRSHSGQVFSANEAALQNKSDRYYFTEAIQLPAGSVYLSPIDLNIEHGQVEEPWRPVMRFAAPVTVNGITRGVLVMNLETAPLLTELTTADTKNSRISLLNDDGYWLTGAPEERLWGFMFGKSTTLSVLNPLLWKLIHQQTEGELSLHQTHYVYSIQTPDDLLPEGLSKGSLISQQREWIFLAEFTEPQILIGFRDWPRLLPLLMLSLLFSVLLTYALRARQHEEKVNQFNQQRLAELDRLASLGNAVASVAHEVNTPVGNALTIASTINEHTDELIEGLQKGRIGKTRLQHLLQELNDGNYMLTHTLEKASRLIADFKQIAVDQTSERRREFILSNFLEEIRTLLNSQKEYRHIQLVISSDPDLTLNSYPGPLSQIIINLVNNASLHAFTDSQNGEILISAFTLGEDRVGIKVSDNGQGIDPALLPKIFDPFFTTRANTGGSGLGLNIVQTIVTGTLGGTIRVTSEQGAGTSFILELPLSAPEAEASNSDQVDDEGPEPAGGILHVR
tara:strand:- start:99673 stop:101607 length:1935 start_codon:yes stop_codon:yes gene_type:complete